MPIERERLKVIKLEEFHKWDALSDEALKNFENILK